jgi:Na+/H+-dicarboxylate symporter
MRLLYALRRSFVALAAGEKDRFYFFRMRDGDAFSRPASHFLLDSRPGSVSDDFLSADGAVLKVLLVILFSGFVTIKNRKDRRGIAENLFISLLDLMNILAQILMSLDYQFFL